MASIRQVAQDMLDVARDGIGWIAFWKDGRGWGAEDFYVNYDTSTGRISLSDEDAEALRQICDKHPDAIFVNSYVHNLGVLDDEGARTDLEKGLRWQHSLQHYLVADAIA